jgi:hypothetical protein
MLFALVAGPEDPNPRHKEESVPVQDEAKNMATPQDDATLTRDEEAVQPAEDDAEADEWELQEEETTEAAPKEAGDGAAVARESDHGDEDLFMQYYRSRRPELRERLV